MTIHPARDRSHESIINDALARFLRERCGLSSVAETLHGGRRPDIIVRLSSGPVVLEIEIEPAPTVEADALSRLGMELDGSRVQNVFAVRVPERLRSTGQEHLYERMATADSGLAGVAHRWHLRPQAIRLRNGVWQRRRQRHSARGRPG